VSILTETDRYFGKLRSQIQRVIDVYWRASIIPEATNHRTFVEGADDPAGFLQIGLRYLVPKEWFEGEANIFPDITDMARNVAIGEERLLWKNISTEFSGETLKVPEVLPQQVNSAIAEMINNGLAPTVMFAPVELYSTIHSWVDPAGHPYYAYPAGPRTFYLAGGSSLRIFWSNKYSPLDRIIIYDKSFGSWIVKPQSQTGSYLWIEPKPSDRDSTKFDITIKTVAKFVPQFPERARIIVPERLPELRN
jgi:hypothetical protein